MAILLFENKADDLEVYGMILTENGFELDIATGPRQAKNYLKDNPGKYELIILDSMMPAEGLFEEVPENRVRDTKGGLLTGLIFFEEYIRPRKIPTVIFTAYTDIDEVQKFMNDEQNKSLIRGLIRKKGLHPLDFLNYIRNCLSG